MPKKCIAIVLTAMITASLGCSMPVKADDTNVRVPDHHTTRVAERLQRRIMKRHGQYISLSYLYNFVLKKEQLMRTQLTGHFIIENGQHDDSLQPWNISFARYPSWLEFSMTNNAPELVLSESAVRLSLLDSVPEELPQAQHGFVSNIESDEWVTRGEVVGSPQSGYSFDAQVAAQNVIDALNSQKQSVDIPVTYEEGSLFVQSENGMKELKQLSSGRSNYKGSPFGRRANVEKAITEQLHGIVIPHNEKFSFNRTMINSSGWSDALVIVNGKDLITEPGGGVCQAATTAFRAALLAGLPVLKRQNHSLYVTYYKEYGVGIDATVYPGKQDFSFLNDTPDTIVMVGRIDGDDAYIELYGQTDGRTVELEGPYFAADESPLDRTLYRNEIAWTTSVEYADGHVRDETIVSRYLALPKALREEFAFKRNHQLLASASE